MGVRLQDFINSNGTTVDSDYLMEGVPNYITIELPMGNSQIIKGRVINEKEQPSAGAIIMVMEIHQSSREQQSLGYAVTDDHGYYAFAIRAKETCLYKLTVYEPISSE